MDTTNDSHCRSVFFKGNQDAVDLYRCIENGHVYARIPGVKGSNPKWTTTSVWIGGYEPCSPVKVGICFNILDAYGKHLGYEECIKDPDDPHSTIVKEAVAPFSYTNSKEIAQNYRSRFDLISYDEWRTECIKDKNLVDPKMDTDTWIYNLSKTVSVEQSSITDWFNRKLFIECSTIVHNVSKKTYEMYTLVDADSNTLEICGFKWI